MKLVDQPHLTPAENGQRFIVLSVHVLPIQIYRPACGHVHPADDVQKRGLAGAGGADDCGELPLFDGKRDMVKGGNTAFAFAVDLAQVFNL